MTKEAESIITQCPQDVSRREFVVASGAIAAAFGLSISGLLGPEAEGAVGAAQVVWLQGQACTGCSVSLLNSIYYMTPDKLLVDTIDLAYHPNLMAASGSTAVSAAKAAYDKGGYILVVEGAIPTGASGKYCKVWDGMTMLKAVRTYAPRAAGILAVGTCASYGGIPAAAPRPTLAKSVKAIVGTRPVVNIPGCPSHPDWIIGTVAYMLANGRPPALDSIGRPRQYFPVTVHSRCPYIGTDEIEQFGQRGCLIEIGCRGPETFCDCPDRKWNSAAQGAVGVNWCVQAGSPCHGCTQPNFPDGMTPFFKEEEEGDDD
jgi:hydrogenase small subunit